MDTTNYNNETEEENNTDSLYAANLSPLSTLIIGEDIVVNNKYDIPFGVLSPDYAIYNIYTDDVNFGTRLSTLDMVATHFNSQMPMFDVKDDCLIDLLEKRIIETKIPIIKRLIIEKSNQHPEFDQQLLSTSFATLQYYTENKRYTVFANIYKELLLQYREIIYSKHSHLIDKFHHAVKIASEYEDVYDRLYKMFTQGVTVNEILDDLTKKYPIINKNDIQTDPLKEISPYHIIKKYARNMKEEVVYRTKVYQIKDNFILGLFHNKDFIIDKKRYSSPIDYIIRTFYEKVTGKQVDLISGEEYMSNSNISLLEECDSHADKFLTSAIVKEINITLEANPFLFEYIIAEPAHPFALTAVKPYNLFSNTVNNIKELYNNNILKGINYNKQFSFTEKYNDFDAFYVNLYAQRLLFVANVVYDNLLTRENLINANRALMNVPKIPIKNFGFDNSQLRELNQPAEIAEILFNIGYGRIDFFKKKFREDYIQSLIKYEYSIHSHSQPTLGKIRKSLKNLSNKIAHLQNKTIPGLDSVFKAYSILSYNYKSWVISDKTIPMDKYIHSRANALLAHPNKNNYMINFFSYETANEFPSILGIEPPKFVLFYRSDISNLDKILSDNKITRQKEVAESSGLLTDDFKFPITNGNNWERFNAVNGIYLELSDSIDNIIPNENEICIVLTGKILEDKKSIVNTARNNGFAIADNGKIGTSWFSEQAGKPIQGMSVWGGKWDLLKKYSFNPSMAEAVIITNSIPLKYCLYIIANEENKNYLSNSLSEKSTKNINSLKSKGLKVEFRSWEY